ncbi:MAG: NUDIX domain-containing protein, partial [Candidatus Saccharibacteria bacterium]|nr:NUDIX domain-containing protein [Candidatus Saccharibacteria bacterium]
VELNDSWQSAIKVEMREEAGLIAKEVDLVPFATISGPNYRYEYPNGDKTRPFTLVFLCESFSEQDLSDSDEILEKRWFSLEDVQKLTLTDNAFLILNAYKKYNETKVFQQIIV